MSQLTADPLIRAIRILSLSAEEQLRILYEWGIPDVIDELALQFDDFAILADQLFESGQLETKQLELVKEIDRLLADMSGEKNAALWTPEALRNSPLWEKIRLLSREFLSITE